MGTCVAFVARAANFLVDGVSSRVGKTVGQRAWSEVPTHVHLSVRWSALLGAASVPPLLLLRRPLLAGLLDLAGDVQQVAAGYWVVRSAAIPLQLLAMAAAGILQVRHRAALLLVCCILYGASMPALDGTQCFWLAVACSNQLPPLQCRALAACASTPP